MVWKGGSILGLGLGVVAEVNRPSELAVVLLGLIREMDERRVTGAARKNGARVHVACIIMACSRANSWVREQTKVDFFGLMKRKRETDCCCEKI